MSRNLLNKKLNDLYQNYDREYLYSDPLGFLHKYKDPADIEVVGLICSSLAYGGVGVIQNSIQRILEIMGEHPAEYVRQFDATTQLADFSGFYHRFNSARDMALLIQYMQKMIENAGSIGGFFRMGYNPDAANIRDSLASFVERALALDCSPMYPDGKLPQKASARFFFPSPNGGSACKRLNLYLRWMVRRNDGLDFGLWDYVSPSQLVIPLDTHIARISRLIGLTERKSAGWSMAVDITENLKKLDPTDPIKYDFAICRLGILAKCPRIPQPEKCRACEIKSVCSQ